MLFDDCCLLFVVLFFCLCCLSLFRLMFAVFKVLIAVCCLLFGGALI